MRSVNAGGANEEEIFAMAMLRDYGTLDRFPYLASLGIAPDDAGRLDVVDGAAGSGGIYVEASTGVSRLFTSGDAMPAGVWVAQRDIDIVKPAQGTVEEPHGFGEGWGTQGVQIGGDRSYPEEDTGGTIRVPHDVRTGSDQPGPESFGSAPGTVTTAQSTGTGTGSEGGQA